MPITAATTNADTTNGRFRPAGLLNVDAAGMKGISANAIPVASSEFGASC